jgi:C1A family cysteine protease
MLVILTLLSTAVSSLITVMAQSGLQIQDSNEIITIAPIPTIAVEQSGESTHTQISQSTQNRPTRIGTNTQSFDEFSPLEHVRTREYESHLLTESEVDELKEKIGVREPKKNYNLISNGFGTGLAPPTSSEWDAMVGNIEVVDEISSTESLVIPSNVDHSTSSYFPPVRSQAAQGSCAAWATTYYTATYLQAKDEGWTGTSSGNNNQILSPAWTYNKANYGYDSGSHSWTNYYVLETIGGVTWNSMPYNYNDDISWGSVSAWREAPKYRCDYMKWTDPQEIDIIRSWVADGFVIPFAFHSNQYQHLGTNDDTITGAEHNTNSYNHANTIVGYDDTRVTDGEIGAFKCVNSWGSNWGSAWKGYGYYWMTYKAFAELVYPVIMFYDKVDYKPTYLATWNLTGNYSRDSDIKLGIGDPESPIKTRVPYLNGGAHNYPAFMCLDITEFRDSVGLQNIYLNLSDGQITEAKVSAFNLELYENGYSSSKSGASEVSGKSPEVPQAVPGFVNNSISGYQIKINSPQQDVWYRNSVTSAGIADNTITETIFTEDFESNFPGSWEVGDTDNASGYDYWGNTTFRSKSGFRSAWCAEVSEPIYEEDFDQDGAMPENWIVYSEGPDNRTWDMTNTGYDYVFDGDDYGAFCDSNLSGPGTNITEWIYMNQSFSAKGYSNVYLEFLLAYNHSDGDEYAQVLYSYGSKYPTFYNLKTWTNDTYGKQRLNLSAVAGLDNVYLGFRYHGTNDHYMFIDDIRVTTNTTSNEYDDGMVAYIYREVNLTKFDMVNLSYDYWLNSENKFDSLNVVYYSGGKWHHVDGHTGSSSGWKSSYVLIPNNATWVGLDFESDSLLSNYEGGYIDNINLTGYINLSTVEFQLDSGSWNSVNGTTSWNLMVNTSYISDGGHSLTVRAKYGANYSLDRLFIKSDNTLPNSFSPLTSPSTWTSNDSPILTFGTTDAASGVDKYELKIDTGGYSQQISPYQLLTLSDGIHNISVRAIDVAGNFRMGYVDVYIDTTNPNSFTPTATPSSWSNNTQPVITFSTTDTPSGLDHYKLQLDSGSFRIETSPYTPTPQSDGIHTVTIRAYDQANNYREGSVNLYVDTVPPRAFTPTANPAGWTNDTQPVISFSTIDDTSGIDHYEVKIDSGTFSTQTSPYTLPVQSNGAHNVTIRAMDLAGNYRDRTVVVYIDTEFPTSLEVIANPDIWSQTNRPVITFFAIDAISGIDRYELKIDSGDYSVQTSPYTLPPQSNGVHTVTVRAYDKAGRFAQGSVNVYVDKLSPNTFTPILSPSGWSSDTQPVITFGTTDNHSGCNYYELKLDDGEFFAQTSPYMLSELADGVYDLTIRAYDYAGNVRDAVVKIYVDAKAPLPFTPIVTPSGWTKATEPVLEFETSDVTSGIKHYEVNLDYKGFSVQTSPFTLPNLFEGIHNISVRAIDYAGNFVEGYVDAFIDTESPVHFTPQVNVTGWTNNNRPTVSFSTIDNTSGISHYMIKINGSGFSLQSSPFTLPSQDDGVHEIIVRAFDLAGNYKDSATIIFIDTTAPSFGFTEPVDGIWIKNESQMIYWTQHDSLSGIRNVSVQIDNNNRHDFGFSNTFNFNDLTEGEHTIFVTVFDNASNSITKQLTFKVDLSPPVLIIEKPAYRQYFNRSNVKIAWSGTDVLSGIGYYEIKLDNDEFIDVGTTMSFIVSGLLEGEHTAYIRAFDVAGNNFQESIVFVIDTTKPSIFIDNSFTNATIQSPTVEFNWSGMDFGSGIAGYQVKLSHGNYIDIGSATSYTLHNITEGNHTLFVKAVDNAGNRNEINIDFNVMLEEEKPFGDEESKDDRSGEYNSVIISIFIIILIIILLLSLMFIRRKKQQEQVLEHDELSYNELTVEDITLKESTFIKPDKMDAEEDWSETSRDTYWEDLTGTGVGAGSLVTDRTFKERVIPEAQGFSTPSGESHVYEEPKDDEFPAEDYFEEEVEFDYEMDDSGIQVDWVENGESELTGGFEIIEEADSEEPEQLTEE